MRAVNLLPREESRGRGPELPKPVAITSIAGLTLVLALLGLLFVNAHGTVTSRQGELAEKQQELAAIPVPAQNQLQQQDALVADKQGRVTALNAALSRRIAWDRVLREFALVLPDDVWLLNLAAHSPVSASTTAVTAAASTPSSSASVTATALGFTIEGYTYSHEAVARLLTRLSLVPDLQQVQLVKSEQAKLGSRSIVHFSIAANVRAPGAGS